ncbi:MAG: hypothetical protein ACI9MC_000610 [Kiritimatiellia bacterium]|jgi:hypothetical protein
MPEKKLRDTLADLKLQLEEPHQLASDEMELLLDVQDDIERLLEQTSETRRVEAPEVNVRVGNVVERFVSDHPQVTDLLNRLAETLAGLGI